MRALDGLERVSLLLVLGGLAVMYVASVAYEPPLVSLADVDETRIGETVRVDGNVTDHRVSDAAQFVTLRDDNRRMTAVYFGTADLDVTPHLMHRIEGEVDVYQGELELIIRRIEPLGRHR